MKKNNKGFTLAELLIVVAIIGVLVAISIPIFARQKLKAQEAVDKANLRAAYAEVMAAAASDPDHSWYVPVKMTHKGNYGVNNARQFYLVSSDETIAGISTAGINHPNEGIRCPIYFRAGKKTGRAQRSIWTLLFFTVRTPISRRQFG